VDRGLATNAPTLDVRQFVRGTHAASGRNIQPDTPWPYTPRPPLRLDLPTARRHSQESIQHHGTRNPGCWWTKPNRPTER
jgi:hypothetical protein